MRYVLLAIFVLFAAQPSQASYCDMCDGQDTGDSQQSSMHDGAMMDHASDHQIDSGQEMDCCDSGPDSSDDGCNPLSHCGASTGSLAVIDAGTTDLLFSAHSEQIFTNFAGVLSRTGSPPFRPPIA